MKTKISKTKGVEMEIKKSKGMMLIVQDKNTLNGRLEIDHTVKAHGENDVRF